MRLLEPIDLENFLESIVFNSKAEVLNLALLYLQHLNLTLEIQTNETTLESGSSLGDINISESGSSHGNNNESES